MAEQNNLRAQMEAAAKQAGLQVAGQEPGTAFDGRSTIKFTLALADDAAKSETLELSDSINLVDAKLSGGLATYLAESNKRLRNPRPDCYVTLGGLPLSFRNFAWPFHRSTSGADTYIVHGEAWLEDGKGAATLHAKVSGSMTVTFSEVIAAPEQPYGEGFIYNAVRKVMDQGQLELVKSGNRQPVPVTTRYYSMKQNKFVFNDTNEKQRQDFLASKVFWLSGVLGGGQPVWLLDPRDAQYLNTTVDALKKTAESLASDGVFTLQRDTEFAVPTESVMNHAPEFEALLQEALNFTKPSFNEEMRAGHTNM